MPSLICRDTMARDENIQGRHPRIYAFLCQLIIAIMTFYFAIAISQYDPTPAVTPQTTLSDANSTTPHICKTGARDDPDAILIAITPYSVLCPSTPFFFLSLTFFSFGIFKFNSLHTEDIDLIDGYSYFIVAEVMFLGRDFSASLRTIPIVIWNATMIFPIGHLYFKTCSPELYWSYGQAMKLQREDMWRVTNHRGETVGNIEAGGEAVRGGEMEGRVDEETPLRRDERGAREIIGLND